MNLASMKLDENINLKLNSELECSDLCDYDNYPQQECLKRLCVDCGTDKLNLLYNKLINSHGEEEIKISK